MTVVGGPDWRSDVSKTVPGGAEQAERDAATFFEVEAPALQQWQFDRESLSRISQPVLFVMGSESEAPFDGARHLFESSVPQTEPAVVPGLKHLLQMQDPKRVAEPVAEFLARQPF